MLPNSALDDRFQDPRFVHAFLQRLPAYLATQRWFTSKSKDLQACKIRDSYRLAEDYALVIIETHYADGTQELFQMPLAQLTRVEDQKQYLKRTPNLVVFRVPGGPYLVDAVPLPAFRRDVYEMIRNEARTRDGLNCECGKLLRQAPATLDSTVPSIDTSNTAIIYGNRFFFKLFRKLDPGLNPDLELVRYLSENTTFANCPPYGGSLGVGKMKDADYLNLGMLSGMVENQGDAWELFQDLTRRYFVDNDGEVDEETIQRAELLGRRTAEMHQALATRLPVEGGGGAGAMIVPQPLTAEYRAEISTAAQKLLDRQVGDLESKVDGLPPFQQRLAREVLELAPGIRHHLDRFRDRPMDMELIRIHADYHLGQVLVTKDDFVIIDFEGEPLLTIPERRRRRPALKDVAGMVRSFHYAIYAQTLLNPERFADYNPVRMDREIRHWYRTVMNAYLNAYFNTADEYAGTGGAAFLPASETDRRDMLFLFMLEKAVYEVAYELNSRPAWLSVPLMGVLGAAGALSIGADEHHAADNQ